MRRTTLSSSKPRPHAAAESSSELPQAATRQPIIPAESAERKQSPEFWPGKAFLPCHVHSVSPQLSGGVKATATPRKAQESHLERTVIVLHSFKQDTDALLSTSVLTLRWLQSLLSDPWAADFLDSLQGNGGRTISPSPATPPGWT